MCFHSRITEIYFNACCAYNTPFSWIFQNISIEFLGSGSHFSVYVWDLCNITHSLPWVSLSFNTLLCPDGRFLPEAILWQASLMNQGTKDCVPGFMSGGDNRAFEVKWTAAIRSVFTFPGRCEWHCVSVPPTPTEPLGKTQMDSVLHRGFIYILHWRTLQICKLLLAEFGQMRCCSVCGLGCLKFSFWLSCDVIAMTVLGPHV